VPVESPSSFEFPHGHAVDSTPDQTVSASWKRGDRRVAAFAAPPLLELIN